jgi:hypothetical protein
MVDVRVSNRVTLAVLAFVGAGVRTFVGVGSLILFFISAVSVISSSSSLFAQWEFLSASLMLGGSIGYLLVGHFCLHCWEEVEDREGIGACMTAVGAALALGVGGTWGALIVADGMHWRWVGGVVSIFGAWMFSGFLLARVASLLRRIMREANAE